MKKQATPRLRYEITIIIMVKLLLIFCLWYLLFVYPHHEKMTKQQFNNHLIVNTPAVINNPNHDKT